MRWITPEILDEWSNRKSLSVGGLPQIIESLIFASVNLNNIREIRFPSGDSVHIQGCDGVLEVENVEYPWIPNGKSVWECKTSKKYRSALEEDINKRSNDPLIHNKEQKIFVCITSRKWNSGDKEAWISEQKKQHPEWKDIKLIDAVELSHWLERCPGVAKRYSENIVGVKCDYTYSPDGFWERFKNRYSLSIKYSAPLAGRTKEAEELITALSEKNYIELASDSIDETIAFIIATIHSYNDGNKKNDFLNKTLIIMDEKELEYFCNYINNYDDLIFIVPENITRNCMALKDKHTLISAGARRIPIEKHFLPRSTPCELTESLKIDGHSEKEESDIKKAAHESGGSLTILERRRPSNKNVYNFEWSERPHISIIIPALLAGSWSENIEGDREIMKILSREIDYYDYQEKINGILRLSDFPIDKEASIFKMIAPIDTLSILAPDLSDIHYELLEEVVLKVFSFEDITRPDENTSYSYATETRYLEGTGKYSTWIKDGLANTLLQIATMHEELKLNGPTGKNPDQFVNELISSLPNLKTDIRVIQSLGKHLPYLMEAAPDPLLEALEYMLKGSHEEIAKIFEAKEGLIAPNYQHTHLLWALEGLAWHPNYLERVAMILASLAKIAPEVNITNSPINSLREIFLPWRPGTHATSSQRLKIIDKIIKREHEIGWEMLVKLLPKSHDVASLTHKPIYRNYNANNIEKLTYGVIWKFWEETLERACTLASNDPERWKIILHETSFNEFDVEVQNKSVEQFKKYTKKISPDEKIIVWNYLRNFVYREKAYPNEKFDMDKKSFNKLSRLLKELEPKDIFEKNKWLFDEQYPQLPEANIDSEAQNKLLEELRVKAVTDIYKMHHTDGIIKFANMIKHHDILGDICIKEYFSIEEIGEIIKKNHGRSDNLSSFSRYLSAIANSISKDGQWKRILRKIINKSQWDDYTKAFLMLYWKDNKKNWDFIDSLGQGVSTSYWKNVRHFYPSLMKDAEFAARKFIENGSALSATEAIFKYANKIDIPLIIEILNKAGDEYSDENNSHIGKSMFDYYIENIFTALINRDDIDTRDLANMEWKYLNILKEKNINLSIYRFMRENPDFYVSVIDAVFKKDSYVNEKIELTQERQIFAQNSYTLLKAFNDDDTNIKELINENKLGEWVSEVIDLAQEKDKYSSAERSIGKFLAHAPEDPEDEIWPHDFVRDIIEDLDLDSNIINSMEIEKLNMQGVQVRSRTAGGEKERETAQEYRDQAEKIKDKHVRTQALLNSISKEYERRAKREDEQARLTRMKSR